MLLKLNMKEMIFRADKRMTGSLLYPIPISLAVMMEAASILETLTDFCQITWCRPEDSHLQANNNVIFWDAVLCSLRVVYRRFGGTCCLYFRGLVDKDEKVGGRKTV